MRLLRLAIENQRWDLAAHTIILATARALSDDEKSESSRRRNKSYGTKSKESKRCPEGNSER